MVKYKILLAFITFQSYANVYGVVLPESSGDTRPSEIAVSIACLYYYQAIDANGSQLKSVLKTQKYLEKLLNENDIPHTETVHYITLTMRNFAKQGIDKEFYKFRCQGLQVID